jgi:predicted RecB family nuclease
MVTRITRDVIESYLNCKFKGYLKLAGELGKLSDYELLMKESGERVRLAATAQLLARHKEGEVLRGLTATPTVLGQSVPLLLDVTVEDGEFSVRLDALRRAAGPSRLGDFHYVPILFHETERPGRKPRALLELLGRVLGIVQGRVPGWGVLINGLAGAIKRLKLGTNVQQCERAVGELKRILGEGAPPRLTLNDHCQVCEYRQRCHAEATARDDLSLLRGVGEKEIRKYERRGIFTVTQLSCTFQPRKRSKRREQKRQTHYHALQALAIRGKKIYLLGAPEPPASPVRIYLDIEGDPARGFEYLLGMIIEINGAEQRHSFWANSPDEERMIFRQFLDVVDHYDDFRLYAYGNYEAAFLRRMIQDSGRHELGEKLLPRLENVLSVVHSHVYFPTYSNGLKDIASYLGFRWTETTASGVQSIVWRRRWEETGSATFKDMLTTYNLEDCAALKRVTECLCAICPGKSTADAALINEVYEVSQVEEAVIQPRMRGWNQGIYAVEEFGYINDRAYFDYQRERVFIRTNKAIRKTQARQRSRQGKKDLRANRHIEISSQACPFCGGTELSRRPNRSLARLAFDLRITRSGIRRRVTRFTTTWHHCADCAQRFLPGDYLRLEEFCHSLKSWAMYEYVAHRTSLANIADTIRECFDMPVDHSQVYAFKQSLARYYAGTYKVLLEKILAGILIHGDETEVHVRRVGQAYVWVLTNLEEVVFLYRPSREGDFLHDLLKDFRGVFVSDFYAAYDSLPCEQQKCLIHLLRDFNQDLLANPWNEELKAIASDFGRLLRIIVATIDLYGLRRRHLDKHSQDVDKFFRVVSDTTYRSDAAAGYQQRLLKYRDELFTFLHQDGIPWNNNNAEHAVKAFAYYRAVADSIVTEVGLNQYLVLLSVYQTCKYKGVSFLKFLLSRETDIAVFRESGSRTRTVPGIEVYPEGVLSSRPSRRRLGVAGSPGGNSSAGDDPLPKGAGGGSEDEEDARS